MLHSFLQEPVNLDLMLRLFLIFGRLLVENFVLHQFSTLAFFRKAVFSKYGDLFLFIEVKVMDVTAMFYLHLEQLSPK